jgi:hypothetical protein
MSAWTNTLWRFIPFRIKNFSCALYGRSNGGWGFFTRVPRSQEDSMVKIGAIAFSATLLAATIAFAQTAPTKTGDSTSSTRMMAANQLVTVHARQIGRR